MVARSGDIMPSIGGDKFDHYVSDQSQCSRDEPSTPGWVQSADNPSCFVGYSCEYFYD
jgi:hypothetical protein